jgi:signal transduction histidine kinase/ligand-binding sensor domain-containing protein
MMFAVFRALGWRWVAGCIVIWTVAVRASSDADWIVRTWQPVDGLPGVSVTGLSQTKDGFLWVASRDGLARFDGIHFESVPLTNFPGLSSRNVSKFLVAQSGGLWLSLNRGPVAFLNSGSADVIEGRFGNNGLATAMVEDNDGSLLVAFGPEVFRVRNKAVQRLKAESGLPTGICFSMIRDTRGQIWIAKGSQVGILRNDQFEKSFTFRTERALCLAPGKSGGVWICVNDQLLFCDEKGELKEMGSYGTKNSLPRPTSLLEVRDGSVWIGTRRNGLFHFDGEIFESVPTSDSAILCLASDREGNVWAGTAAGGLDQVRPKILQLEGAATGLAEQTVQSVCEDPQGRLWGLSRSGLLLVRSNGQWSAVSVNTNWPNLTELNIAIDRDGAVWTVTTGNKLACWQDGTLKLWSLESGIAGPSIRKVLADSRGDIWASEGPPEILQVIHHGNVETLPLPKTFHRGRAMAEDTHGNIFLAGLAGDLIRVRTENGSHVTEQFKGLPARTILSLAPDSDGSLWIGYSGLGLGRFKDGKVSLIGTEQGLCDGTIAAVVEDDRGSLWFGSERGIFRAEKSALNAVADGRSTRVQCVRYESEGVSGPLHARGAGIKTRDGRIWMPMGTALAIINPNKVTRDALPPPVFLTGMELDGRAMAAYGGGIIPVNGITALEKHISPSLRVHYHRLQFDFTALDFTSPGNVSFRYQLENFDPGWTEPDPRRSATYPELPPGKYRFRVMACSGSGVWNEAGTSFAFTVLPFFWQTWWFRICVAMIFTAAVLSAGRYFFHQKLKRQVVRLEQQAALNRERARIARDLHDDLGSCLTQIVLVSGLNRRGRISPEKAVDDVQAAARYAIKALDQTVWAINPHNDTLPAFINYTSQFVVDFLRTAGIKCRANIPEQLPDRPVPAEVRHNLFLVIKEAINNIVRHSGTKEVDFEVSIRDKSLNLVIEDRGAGFVPAPAAAGADGLRNMRERMSAVNGEFQIETTPGAGTRIRLAVPLPPSA